MAEGHDAACRSLSSKHSDRFSGVDWDATADEAVYVNGSTLWMDCTVECEIPAGDHLIALFRIHVLRAQPETAPFHSSRFRTLADV
ncbi:flavin reductase family protein [Pseudonocardia sp. GCM10023141]|uniref:flavin reductase family protein n=1 Tax=Pseudonocardia sp. GCM10023141 TaxID=3252653 RepID=UPI00361060BB